ncbi:hypothetical protein ASG22_08090 [Chryseobacterium sp. Leaf405]|uniref:DUF6705 family protein n=1 Tax=Chryseobacterium sp. Leaf405 TaxID=1736367 RepID=UPI0006FCF808|nr:DUF6705 family protein [Chryseobacterium sp. Leaf405]KQT23974.1 hypothetical protein ASG22_08090 [Chryseobacterium sp. Leaf405]
MMKNLFLIILIITTVSCKAQTYLLRTFTEIPENSYLKDTNNELQYYEGTWKGEWNNKIIYISFKKLTNTYKSSLNQYRDFLIGRFKVTDLNNNILFDNTNLNDDKAKITGGMFRKSDDKYGFTYVDRDLCMRSGQIFINFTDATKTQLQWKYIQSENWIDKDCFYHGWVPADVPQPLPNDIILTKQ